MMRTEIFTLVLSLLLGFSALAAPLDINTHTAAVPEPSFKLAATWFLPDWQAALSGRTDNAPDNSGDRQDLTCSTYGGCANIPANTTCSQTFSAKGTTCYKSCSCKSGYNRVSSADICLGCANPCDTVTAVPTPYGCKTPWPVCPSKCQVAYPDNCHNRTAVPTPYGCQTPWSDCSTKCQTAYPDNCRNYSSKPLASSCANGCAQGRTLSDCTSRCAVGCKARCDTGYHLSSDQLSCVADSCPGGYTAGKTCGAGYSLEKSGQSGTQYCGKCVVKACAAGSTTCAAGQISEANGYYSGEQPCYTCETQKTPLEICLENIDKNDYVIVSSLANLIKLNKITQDTKALVTQNLNFPATLKFTATEKNFRLEFLGINQFCPELPQPKLEILEAVTSHPLSFRLPTKIKTLTSENAARVYFEASSTITNLNFNAGGELAAYADMEITNINLTGDTHLTLSAGEKIPTYYTLDNLKISPISNIYLRVSYSWLTLNQPLNAVRYDNSLQLHISESVISAPYDQSADGFYIGNDSQLWLTMSGCFYNPQKDNLFHCLSGSDINFISKSGNYTCTDQDYAFFGTSERCITGIEPFSREEYDTVPFW